MRVAVLDIGTNSTRLLVADVEGGRIQELVRRSTVTRLGRGVDTSRHLSTDAIEDVCDALAEYIRTYEPLSPDRLTAIATSAVRDADNSAVFLAELRERFALNAHVLDGDDEARLTYLGANAHRSDRNPSLVVDIGGGSTELVLGSGSEMRFHTSLQAGTVRHTERYLTNDPPEASQLEDLAGNVRRLLDERLEGEKIAPVERGIAVAGTPTSLAAIDQQLDPYDPDLVHGYFLPLERIQRMCSMLATRSLQERLKVKGLHPGRAPTIVAGVIILIQVMRAFELREIEVSEHDILYGAALGAAAAT